MEAFRGGVVPKEISFLPACLCTNFLDWQEHVVAMYIGDLPTKLLDIYIGIENDKLSVNLS